MLSQLLDASVLRHQVLAQNVANVNTPGYRRLDVSFADALRRQLGGQTIPGQTVRPAEVIASAGGPERADGNNVDIDVEVGRLSKNALLHGAYIQILANKIAMMRSAITGR